MNRVLIVEDDAVIGFDLADYLEGAGFSIAGVATTLEAGLALCEQCDVAILDVDLGSRTSEPIAARLAQLHKPFITVTGYATDELPAIYAEAPRCGKPVALELLPVTLQGLLCSAD